MGKETFAYWELPKSCQLSSPQFTISLRIYFSVHTRGDTEANPQGRACLPHRGVWCPRSLSDLILSDVAQP